MGKEGTHAERDAASAADDADKLVEVVGPDPGEDHARRHRHRPEHVLLPLDLRVRLARFGEQTVLHDSDGGEQLQRRRQQDRERIEELAKETYGYLS